MKTRIRLFLILGAGILGTCSLILLSVTSDNPHQKLLERFEAAGGFAMRSPVSPEAKQAASLRRILPFRRETSWIKEGDVVDLERGSIPSEDLALLDSLPYLRSLKLVKTPLTEDFAKHLKSQKDLYGIFLSDSRATDSSVKELVSALSGNNFMAIELLKSELTSEGIRSLAQSPRLVNVRVESDKLDGTSLRLLSGFSLSSLGVIRWKIGDEDLTYIVEHWPRLMALDLSGTKVSLKGIRKLSELKELQSLYLNNTEMEIGCLSELKSFPRLSHLYLQGTQTKDSDLEIIAETLPKLYFLDVSDSSITDSGLVPLARMKDLGSFSAAGTKLSDQGMRNLVQIPKCHAFDLRGTEITDLGAQALAGYEFLGHIDLSETALTDQGLKYLMQNKGIININLDKTKITAAGLKEVLEDPVGLANVFRFQVRRTVVTREMILKLAAKYPRTTIESDFGVF